MHENEAEMKWNELYDANTIPSREDIESFIGGAFPLWEELTQYIEEKYQTKSRLDYSSCSAQPGWNIKYRKRGKSLCTMYPMQHHFIVLIVVGKKEESNVEREIHAGVFTSYVQQLYWNTPFSAMGRWMMIEVRDVDTIQDIKTLLVIKQNP